MLEEMTGISRETVRKILVKDFKKKKVCGRFVPHLLMPDQNYITLYCIALPASKVTQYDCRMWNMSHYT
jgi:hypothetical protein